MSKKRKVKSETTPPSEEQTASQVVSAVLEWGLEPVFEKCETFEQHCWTTVCGRYQVRHVTPTLDKERAVYFVACVREGGRWDSCEYKDGTTEVRRYKSLDGALQNAEAHLREVLGERAPELTSNSDFLLSHALKLGLAVRPHTLKVVSEEGEEKTPRKKREPKAPSETDALGARVGSVKAKVNAVLTTTPKLMRQIMEEAGLTETHYNHLNKLVSEKKVVKSAKGYALPLPPETAAVAAV